MSSLRQNSNSNSNSLHDQKTEPNEQYGEVDHVIDSIDHRCVQAYDNMCIEGAFTSEITSRMRLRNHHSSQKCPV